MIEVVCPNCGLRILVPPTVQGRWGACFACGAKLMVPKVANGSAEAELTFKPGDRISDRYVIEAHIGKGGMGAVFRAEDSLLGEKVALKFMYPRMLRTQRGQQLFIREAQVARRLRHDNIVAVHDVTSTPEGIMYLSMEFLQGQSLRGFLRRHRQERRLLDVRLAVSLMAQTLAALDYAHRTVIHRDMKPENIMLLPGERVKVLDFGLAKAIDAAPVAAPNDDQPRRVVGTEAYAAPEQVQFADIDGRSDVYAAGLILHELFTLRTPLDEPVQVLDVRRDVAPSLLQVLGRAIREERNARWQTAGDFRQALLTAFEESYRPAGAAAVQSEAGREVSTENMVYMEGGSFLMGCDAQRTETPEFEATVKPFYIDRHPVTTHEYGEFLEETGHAPPKYWGQDDLSGADQPVVGVTWDDACAYAAWAGKQLPTEEQWEYAARGKGNRRYPWGSQEPDPMRCNYGEHLSTPSIVTMHEEGGTPDGVLDMGGNVYEWTQDRFLPYAVKLKPGKGGRDEPRRTVRGGSWRSTSHELRCSWRQGLFPESQSSAVGFRCVAPAGKVRP
ncbi:MAG: SUMF1/EgtB/PvdO family nonheme iron enzyme [bacterium]|nr:SUMF1/EgtB/PvdO family nonheme iron enzyme [bacterium]